MLNKITPQQNPSKFAMFLEYILCPQYEKNYVCFLFPKLGNFWNVN